MLNSVKVFFSAIWKTGVVGAFLTGLFAVLPILLTILIMQWLISYITASLGPGTFFGDLITTGGSAIIGVQHQTLGFLLGVAIVLLGVWFIGFVVSAFARKRLDHMLDRMFSSVPILRTIYKPVARVVRLLRHEGDEDLAMMDVVMCHFGGDTGIDVLALLPSPTVYFVGGEAKNLVYLPTSPLPMTGGLVFVPASQVTLVECLDVDDLMRVYFSLGALGPDVLSGRLPAVPDPTAYPQ